MNTANLFTSDLSQLSRSRIKDYIDKLRREIRHHDDLYYVKDPEISDEEYDRLFDALKRLEQRFSDLTTPDSPTKTALSPCCVKLEPTCRTSQPHGENHDQRQSKHEHNGRDLQAVLCAILLARAT